MKSFPIGNLDQRSHARRRRQNDRIIREIRKWLELDIWYKLYETPVSMGGAP